VIDKSRRHFQERLRTSRRKDGITSIVIGGDQTTTSQLGRNYSLSATNNDNDNERVSHKLAGLKCQEKYGGPEDAYAEKEMAFWSDIPSDASYKSPFMDDDTERYLAFEPDHGGWNNIRSKFQVPRSMLESLYRIQL
jgi:hypothetical protein